MWTQVIEVIQKGEPGAAARALEDFCRSYHPVIVHFFEQQGCSSQDAQDYAQEFFETDIIRRVESRGSLIHRADRNRTGRFRSFLFSALRYFFYDKCDQRMRKKSGGGAPHVPIEEHEFSEDGEAARRMERAFDRAFALEVIQLAARHATRSEQFLACLRGEITQRDAAAQLDITEETFRVAYHRFRNDLRKHLREEVAKLMAEADSAAVEDEIRYLMRLFSPEE